MSSISENEAICRVCLDVVDTYTCLFQKSDVNSENTNADLIMECASVRIVEDVHQPRVICSPCLKNLQTAYNFKQLCEFADRLIRENCLRVYLQIKKSTGKIETPSVKSETDDPITNAYDSTQVVKIRKHVKNERRSQERKRKMSFVTNRVTKGTRKNVRKVRVVMKKSVSKKRKRSVDCDGCVDNEAIQSINGEIIDSGVKDAERTDVVETCKMCRAKFTSTDDYETHLSQGHDSLLQGTSTICIVCHKKFISSQHLHRHVLKQHRVMICQFCGKQSGRLWMFKLHLRIHDRVKMHLCQLCGFSTIYLYSLRKHFTSKHTGERPFKCDICNKAFTLRSRVKEHKIIHHSDDKKTKNFSCELCGKAFLVRGQLADHLRIHKPGYQERQFKCDVCDRSYKKKSTLKEHIHDKHTDMARSFKCPTCSSAFTRPRNLRGHIKKVHCKVECV